MSVPPVKVDIPFAAMIILLYYYLVFKRGS